MLSFKPTFLFSSFTFIKRLFNSSLSAIRVVSSAYLRLLIFLLAIFIPACASPSPVFRLTIYSLDVLLFLFGTGLSFHVQFYLLSPNLYTDFSGGRSGGLVFTSLSEFSTVYCDLHSQRLWQVNKAEIDVFLELLDFLIIYRLLAIWSLAPLSFLNPA